MGNVLKKNFPSVKCYKCKSIINLSVCKDWRQLISINKTLKEGIKFRELTIRRIHGMKNSQLQAMHKVVKMLLDLLTPEQKDKAKELRKIRKVIKK